MGRMYLIGFRANSPPMVPGVSGGNPPISLYEPDFEHMSPTEYRRYLRDAIQMNKELQEAEQERKRNEFNNNFLFASLTAKSVAQRLEREGKITHKERMIREDEADAYYERMRKK